MGGYFVTHHRAGRRKDYHYYVCCRAAKRSTNEYCSNRRHPAGALEETVGGSVACLMCDPEKLWEQVDRRIERERAAVRNPEAEALRWAKRLEAIDAERKRSQIMAAKNQMDLDVLDELLAELKEEREIAERELAAARNRRGRIEDLENERAFVLSWYARTAALNPLGFPPEERRRLYESLGLGAVSTRTEPSRSPWMRPMGTSYRTRIQPVR